MYPYIFQTKVMVPVYRICLQTPFYVSNIHFLIQIYVFCSQMQMIFPIYVSLEKIDRSLLEAGRDLGDSAIRSFFRITLPLAMPGIIAASLIVFIPTIGDYVTPKLVGGTEGMMVANMIQVQFSKANNAPLAAALAIVSLSIVVIISLVFLFFNRKYLRRQI